MQRYTEIPSSATLSESLPLILNNDKTAISCSAGTAFPTVNLQQGMLCFRTDQNKLYILVNAMEPVVWRVAHDCNGDARNLDGGDGNAIDYDKQNLNDWDNMPTGFYEGSNMLNSPSGDTAWRVIQIRQGNSDGYSTQLAFGKTTGKMFTRFQSGGMWSDWQEVYTGTGGTVTGMNADKVDGYDAGNDSGNIPVSNGKLNVNLNADKLDGLDAGNDSGKIPISNGTVNAGLNADQVDGRHAGNESGNVPISNGSLNKNLNAEMVGGVKIDQLVRKNNSGAIDGSLQNLIATNATITNLNVSNFNSRSYSGSTQAARTISGAFTANAYDYDSSSGSGNITSTTVSFHTYTGVGSGSYNLYNAIQRLIQASHTHKTERKKTSSNCNCRCNCDCDCDSDTGCFVSGKLLTSKGEIEVSKIQIGAKIWGADERWHKVVAVAKNEIGNRRVYKMPKGGVVTEDHVIYSGDVAYTPNIDCCRKTCMEVLYGDEAHGVYPVPYDVMGIDGAKLENISPHEKTYSPICEDFCIGYLNGERVLIARKI